MLIFTIMVRVRNMDCLNHTRPKTNAIMSDMKGTIGHKLVSIMTVYALIVKHFFTTIVKHLIVETASGCNGQSKFNPWLGQTRDYKIGTVICCFSFSACCIKE